ncbi:TonB-dependent receptor [Pontibacter sp. BAB1700]|uniref:TonB-dependent receptor n=1 Tax=Pontibacter sp. BAB1700 TaxID=1144253 RepID=UPI00026BC173|nr:TonB-dependent receptor [Pontibacter sp. BAB1700]EJF10258.1 TonB-dependent outer membrane protein [Pontibacter sp. BAB1700]
MRQFIKIIGSIVSLLVLVCFTNTAWGQELAKAGISGSVSTSAGEPLAGVSVVLREAQKGITTDAAGRYEINNVSPGDYTLLISFLGFETQEKSISLKPSQTLELNVSLREKSFEMKGVEIIGKSATREVNEQPYAVTAISTRELQNSTSDAKEVLNRVAGVRVLEEGGLGSNLSFSLNGFSGDQVKFFLDGIPMDNFGSSLQMSDIPVNSIDRIEVYKGVVPVWLGTDALGGAVNIITNRKAKFLDASYSIGSFNTHRLSLNGAYTNPTNGYTFRGNVNYNYSDNNYRVLVPIREGSNIIDTTEVERFHDRYRSGTVKLETGWVNKKYADNLLFGVIASGNDKQVQTGATMNSVYGGIMRNSRSVVPTLRYSKDNLLVDGLNVSLYTAYNITQSEVIDTLRGVTYNWLGHATYTPGSNNGELSRTYTTFDDNDFNSQLNAGYTLSPKHSLAFNYAYSYFRRKAFDAENPDRIENQFPRSLNKQVLGLAYKFDLNEKWSTTLFSKAYFLHARTSKQYDFALETQRTEALESSKQNFGYGLATTYFLLPDLQLKASYEHTYRMPWATEIFGDGLFVQPNPDLGPEQSDNFNAGASYGFKLGQDHQINLESSFVYREAKDLIYQVVRVASPQTYYDNLSETRTLGVEGSLRYQWRDMLRLGGNFTFQDITDQADFVFNESYTNTGWQRNFQKGFRLPNTPYMFGNANAGLTFRDVLVPGSVWNVNYFYNYVEQYFLSWAELGSRDTKKVIPTQSSHNLELSGSFREGRYNVAIECRNLTDALLYDKYYLQKPGRAFYLKFRYVL